MPNSPQAIRDVIAFLESRGFTLHLSKYNDIVRLYLNELLLIVIRDDRGLWFIELGAIPTEYEEDGIEIPYWLACLDNVEPPHQVMPVEWHAQTLMNRLGDIEERLAGPAKEEFVRCVFDVKKRRVEEFLWGRRS